MEISVIVPIYNVEKYIEQCLESIICQSFHDFEIICVNDCSPDHSMEIVEEYQKKCEKIKIINNTRNRGLSYSRNIGLENAKGKYILFVDSDDYLCQGTLQILYDNAELKQVEVLYFNKTVVYEDGLDAHKEFEYTEEMGLSDVYMGTELFAEFMERHCFKSMNAYTQFLRKDFLYEEKIRFYDGIVHEDYLFYFMCAMKATRVANIDQQLYVYRKRESSITTNLSKWNKMSMFLVFIEIWNYWKNNNFTPRVNAAIKMFLEHVYTIYQRYSKLINYNGVLELGKEADQYLYQCMMMNRYVSFTDEELMQIKNASEVWVYGAGEVGHEVGIILENHRLHINGYLVTSKRKNPEKIFGWRILQLDELKAQKGALIIIAVVPEKQEDICRSLKEYGFENVLFAVKG